MSLFLQSAACGGKCGNAYLFFQYNFTLTGFVILSEMFVRTYGGVHCVNYLKLGRSQLPRQITRKQGNSVSTSQREGPIQGYRGGKKGPGPRKNYCPVSLYELWNGPIYDYD